MKKKEKSDPIVGRITFENRLRFLELESEQWNRFWNTILDWGVVIVIALIIAACFVIWFVS